MTPDDTFPDVGHRLCAARLQRKLSQATVARRAGIAASYLSRIENGKVEPTFHTLVRVVRGLRATMDEIVSPDPVELRKHGACPISRGGQCMLELIRAETASAQGRDAEQYSAREIRVIRRMAEWVRSAGPERLRAMELLLDDLARALPAAAAPARNGRSTDEH